MDTSIGQLQSNNREFRVLTLDGGGIRGAYTAAVLAEIEKKTGKKIVDHFDLIVGTSAGGINALTLVAGLPANSILELFSKHGEDIFPTNFLGWIVQLSWLGHLLEPFGLGRLAAGIGRGRLPVGRPKYKQEQLGKYWKTTWAIRN